MEQQAISVTTLSGYLKQIIDNDQLLYRVKVYGEVSSFNISNGIAYFALKDENALLNCVMFGYSVTKINIGDKVIVQGTPNYYIKGGKLSFNVEKVEAFGEGELYKQFLLLKQRLQNEGLFDLERKKPLPKEIKRIGVVTSETGAVIQDIINVTYRRNDQMDIVLYPVKVQGQNAEQQIAKAIMCFNDINVDAVIVARGGGSEEDLLPFNTEVVVRAVANCDKFVVSAVGHETDYTLVDFVADLRAPTPSAAAELLVQERKSYLQIFENFYDKLNLLINSKLNDFDNKFLSVFDRLQLNIERKLKDDQTKIAFLLNDINAKNPLVILEKGYAKLEKQNKSITSIEQLNIKDEITGNLKDGYFVAEIKEINNGFW